MTIASNHQVEKDASELPIRTGQPLASKRKIPRRYDHFLFGTIQSGITSFVASAIASRSFLVQGTFAANLFRSWLIAWVVMLPIVLLAAPFIRRLVHRLTSD